MDLSQESSETLERSDQGLLKRTAEDFGEQSDDKEKKKPKLDEENVQTKTDNGLSDKTIEPSSKEAESKEEVQEIMEQSESSEKVEPQIDFAKKKKCALLLSYCGSGYNGMQRNPGVRTIEEDLTNALLKANAISEDASRNFGKMSFQRCARTDKGVSAARQVVSLKMVPKKELLPKINEYLEPAPIRVFALKKVTRGFNCKSRCTARTYEYLIPTFAFSPSYAHTTSRFRITSEIKDKINSTLSIYEGTHNFHNFTSRKEFGEESSKRYIMDFKIVGESFVEKETEFLVLQVKGQSFMQHQIRKMIGLLIAIIRNCTGTDAITRSFENPKMDIPKAPGLGLILDQVHFDSYNKKFGEDGVHEPLEWSECEEDIEKFKKKFIYDNIIETELKTKSMMRWLNTLSSHSYDSTGMAKRTANETSAKEDQNDSSNAEIPPEEEANEKQEEPNEKQKELNEKQEEPDEKQKEPNEKQKEPNEKEEEPNEKQKQSNEKQKEPNEKEEEPKEKQDETVTT